MGRNWLLAWISKGVEHRFEQQIEQLRADLRKAEELFKSELRDREAEIAALRNTLLAGSGARQALLDKRRFDAVEKVWTSVNELAQLKVLASSMANLNFSEVAKRINDPKIRDFVKAIGSVAPDLKSIKNPARDERPFLPELAWAYYQAYNAILHSSYAHYSVLNAGVPEPEKLLSTAATKKMLKAVLPHRSEFVDSQEPETYYYLLDEIEGLLLAELRNILEGRHADQVATARAKEIMSAIKQSEKDQMKTVDIPALGH